MGTSRTGKPAKSFRVTNRGGSSPVLLVCDHASNFVPESFAALGLSTEDLQRHIAWDPGALGVCRRMMELLDALLVESCISRLVIDCNRPLDAPDLIAPVSETTPIPGNANVSPEERARRITLAYYPYHAAIEDVVSERLRRGQETWLVAIHSFTPVYRGFARPWHIGVIHDDDERLARPMIEGLKSAPGIKVGVNEPYSPADRVYFTLERHARTRGLPCVMIEIRNDEIADERGQYKWAELLAGILRQIRPSVPVAASLQQLEARPCP